VFGKLSEGLILNDTGILFPRVKIYKEEEEIAEKHEELISIDYFKKVDLRVGKVIEANRIEKSKKLILLKINVGGNQVKQVVAGIGNTYSPEALIGKSVVFYK
jgi:methionyl-tRNA synthetase